ncbi:MAG: hypothetical protein ACI4PG_13000 [Candidatus Ventricola sp.]
MDYGASIERGTVLCEEDGGWRVQSLTRPGITTPPLGVLCGSVAAGELVAFFLFDDGDGMILGTIG